MSRMKLLRRQIMLAFVTALALIGFTICSTQGWAEVAESGGNSLDNVRIQFVPPPSDGDGDPTGRKRGGGTRPIDSNCPKVDKPLTALVAATKKTLGEAQEGTLEYVWGLTVDKHPTFWFYVPYKSPLSAKFVLLDENDNEFYNQTFSLTEKQGIVSIRLPSDKPLEIRKKYHWFFSILCAPESASANFFVDGWVKRVEPQDVLSATQMNQLENATPRERIVLYAANGIWHDALTLLAERRFTNPSDNAIASDWANLLGDVGLNDISQEPIVQRYTPGN